VSAARRAVFPDRDGTLNVEVAAVARPEDLIPIDGIGDAVRKINDSGFLAILVTNQAIIARGECDAPMLRRIHVRLKDLFDHSGAHLDAIYFCPHHPDYGPPCGCRKPKPGMLLAAAGDFDNDLAQSWVIGDSAKDVQPARNAGAQSALLRTGKGGADIGAEGMHAAPDGVFDTLGEAVNHITGRAIS